MVGSLLRNRFITCIAACAVASPTPPAMTMVRFPSPLPRPALPKVLGQSADQSNRSRGSKRGQVVMVHLVAEAGVANLIESEELVEAVRAAVGHQQAMEGHGKPRLAKGLDRLRFAENPRACGDQHLPSRVRVERIRHEAVHRRGAGAIQPIRQNGVDNGSFEHAMQRSRCADRRRLVRSSALTPTKAVMPADGVGACCGNWAAELDVRPAVRRRGSDNGIGDFVYRRARAICPCRRIGLRRVPTNVWPLVLRTPAQNDVAGKEALVFTPLSIGRDRILRRRRLRVVVLAPAGRSAPGRPIGHLASLARRAGGAGPDSHERGRRSEPARAPSSSLVAPEDPDGRRSA